MTMPVRGVIFDKDGTLFDFKATWQVWADRVLLRLAQGDAALATALGKAIGYDRALQLFDPNSVVIAGTVSEIVGALAPLLPGRSVGELHDVLNAEAARAPQIEATPLPGFMADLRSRGLKTGVVTNDAHAPAMAHLDQAGVGQSFDFVAGYDCGYGAKPDAGPLLAFCDAVGLSPEEVVMVGDSLHDLSAAQAAGMRGIGVLTGMALAEDLAPAATIVLPSIKDVPAWIDAQNAG